MSLDDEPDPSPKRRLRVPAALAVAFVGSAAAVSVWYGGCHADTVDPPVDGGRLEMHRDANVVDAGHDAGHDAAIDAAAPDVPDAPRDAAPPDTPIV
jgi:hypothetical protein